MDRNYEHAWVVGHGAWKRDPGKILICLGERVAEAVSLRCTTAPAIANEFMQFFTRVGLPHEILTDWGTNVTSRLMAGLPRLLNIYALKTSVYHPQMGGLVERFNGTLKSMLSKFVEDYPQHWDKLLLALLFAVREVPQVSTGFSPFELLYGRQPRGILDLLREIWEEQETQVRGSVQYILWLRKRLEDLGTLA